MPDENNPPKRKKMSCSATGGAVYGLGLIGAAVYFIQHAGSFEAGALGLLKAIFWPAFLIYHVLEYLHL